MAYTRSNLLSAPCNWKRQAHHVVISVGLILLCSHDVSAFGTRTTSNRNVAQSPLPISNSKLHAQLIEDGKAWFSALTPALTNNNVKPLPKAVEVKGTVPGLTVSLVKSLVGGGVLAIPAAVAALGDAPDAVLPVAVALIAVMGLINAYYFSLMGQVCAWTGASTFSQAWEKTVGAESSPIVAGIVSIKTLLSCLAYSMILGDSFQSLALTAGFDVSRTDALIAVTGTALLPLCLMKDLSSLAPFSLAGIAGFAFTAASMTARMNDGSYHLAPLDTPTAGRFLQDLADPMVPSFGETGPELQGLVLACTLATAFVAHYNAPRFHAELEQKESFDRVTYTSFGISASIMAVIAVAGYSTFGIASQPMILNNYSPYDPLVTACRAAIAASLVVTFPLPFVGLRDGVLDALKVPADERSDNVNVSALSVALLATITCMAASVHDLSLLLSVGGGTISTAVSSVFPTMMYRAAVAKQQQQQQTKTKQGDTNTASTTSKKINRLLFDTKLATGLMGVCVATGATGVTLALQNHFVHG